MPDWDATPKKSAPDLRTCEKVPRPPRSLWSAQLVLLWLTFGASCSPGSSPNGYWSDSCVSGDGRYLLASVFVTGKGKPRRTDLLPERFGRVGAARHLATADTFAVRFGNLLRDGRLVLAAGWQPSQNMTRREEPG